MKLVWRIASVVLIFTLVCVNNIAQAQKKYSFSFDSKLQKLLDQKEYFKLEEALHEIESTIDVAQKKYFQCYLDNVFNRNSKVIDGVDNLLQQYSTILTDSVKAALLALQTDSYFKQFLYAKAAINDSILLNKYAALFSSEKLQDIKNDLVMGQAFKNIPPQETIISDGAVIQWKKSNLGLIEIPVKFNDENYGCVFDTKANLSCVSESYALKLKLKIFDVPYETGSGITGIKFATKLAIADSIYIGNILIKNAAFIVIPDSKLRFSIFSIHVIIGFPIIEQLKEIQLYKDGRMIIPATTTKSRLHNLALDGYDPLVQLKTGEDTLCFHIDLGATNTNLYAQYFEKYKDSIIKEGKDKNVRLGGAGGSRKKSVYIIPVLDLWLNNKNVAIKKINVFTTKLNAEERFYGSLGRDFEDKFNVLIFNFEYMYLDGQ